MDGSMNGPLLVINSGSSSLKLGLYGQREGREAVLFKGSAEHIGGKGGSLSIEDDAGRRVFHEEAAFRTQREALRHAVTQLEKTSGAPPVAIGHRVVHGGPHLLEHQELTGQVLQTLRDAVHFAPLHLPPALELIDEARAHLPGVRQFACFDTVFHKTLPEEASVYPVPREYRERGVRRYGFHGLSYESIVKRLEPQVPERTVVAHLGSGASLTALHHGLSVATSMGLTPTGGIPMGTRTGDLDPGVLLWLMRAGPLDVDALESLVNHDSGLEALSGGTSDLRALTSAARAGEPQAELALAVFTRSILQTIGAYAAVLGGLDLLVFTGGIGEHSAEVRQRVCSRLAHLGVQLDAHANQEGQERISTDSARCTVRVIPSDEEGQIVRHVRRLLGG